MTKFYLTTAIPYVNGKPHIGHALEYFQADTIRRHRDLKGDETLLLSGADENAIKNVHAAKKENLSTQEYLDKYSKIWNDTYEFLGVHLDVFQRGSDQKTHWPGVQKLWNLCLQNGDIYKKTYKGLYCVGCESFKTEDELINGLCPEHQTKPESVEEENYFFKLSKYQNELITLIETNQFKITPHNKRSETLAFIKSGLEDFSVSRSKKRAGGVGVPVPNDPDQVIYVWFDALNIYMTGVGYATDEAKWKKWWPADLHVIGKDINRFHTVYWPAILLSAKLPIPKGILIHGFVTSGGQKISKSLGNVIDPYEIVNKYGLEPVRYYLLSQIPIDSDGDITYERLEEVYNADLANGLGNLVARVASMAEKAKIEVLKQTFDIETNIKVALELYQFDKALDLIWNQIRSADKLINERQAWKLEGQEKQKILIDLINRIRQITTNLKPFLPSTAEKIETQFKGPTITTQKPLFPRL